MEGPETVREALGDLTVVGLNARMGETSGVAAMPGHEARRRPTSPRRSTPHATVGAGAVHVVRGCTAGCGPPPAASPSAWPKPPPHAPELTFLVEPLCHAGAARVRGRLGGGGGRGDPRSSGAPNVKIMFDCFHVQRDGGDVLARFRDHVDHIGHVQIAGGLTRQEPDRGELNYPFLLPAFVEAGYTGPFGCEYTPATTVEAGLGWRDAFTPAAAR